MKQTKKRVSLVEVKQVYMEGKALFFNTLLTLPPSIWFEDSKGHSLKTINAVSRK